MSGFQLTLRSGSDRGRSWSLGSTPVTIGRDEDCDVVIAHASVSRRHCMIVTEDIHVYLKDLNSRNGTLVNGKPVSSCKLKVGDEIALGEVSLMLTGEVLQPDVVPRPAVSANTTRIQFLHDSSGSRGVAKTAVRGLPQNVEDLARLFRLCRACGAAESIGELLQLVEQEVSNRLQPRRYWLALQEGEKLEILGWLGVPSGKTDTSFPMDLAKRAVTNGDSRIVTRNSFLEGSDSRLSTILCAITLSSETLGVIVVEERVAQREYNDADVEFLASLCFALAPFIKLQDQKRALEAEVARYRAEASKSLTLVGTSELIKKVCLLIQLIAKSQQSILITGETGTGKELVAKMIHAQSERSRGPFVAVNCAAIPSELFETEVFGHERGAFTGATNRRVGLLEESDGGTLFLDEIGDLSPQHQARILRALETHTFRRLGGDRDIHVDFRVLAATNKDLGDESAPVPFRSDLYHRLKGFEISLPPLRDHAEDIPELAALFLKEARENARKPIRGFTPEALDYLRQCTWGGNVRELRQSINSAALLCQGDYIDADLFKSFGLTDAGDTTAGTLPTLEAVEREHIIRAMTRVEGRVADAATILGIARSTLYEKLRAHGIDRQA